MWGGGKCLFVTPCRDECQLLIFTGLNKCKKTMLPNRKDWTVITKWLKYQYRLKAELYWYFFVY